MTRTMVTRGAGRGAGRRTGRGAARRVGRGGVPATIAMVVSAVAFIGRWGGVGDDRIDAVNIVLPYLIGACLVAAGLALVRTRGGWHWPRWTTMAALLLLAAGPIPLAIRQSFAPYGTGVDCKGPAFRLVSFNAWKDNRRPETAARWIRLARADAVIVAEGLTAPRVADLLIDDYPFQQSCAGGMRCSTMILSRHAPIAAAGLAGADPENRRALSAVEMRLRVGDRPLTLVGVHLGRPWPWHRFVGERAALARFVATQDRANTIVAGDMNLPAWTNQMRALEQALGLTRVTRLLPSWPAIVAGRRTPAPLLGIDHVFAGSGWQAKRVERGPFLGSDHYPVVTDFQRCEPST